MISYTPEAPHLAAVPNDFAGVVPNARSFAPWHWKPLPVSEEEVTVFWNLPLLSGDDALARILEWRLENGAMDLDQTNIDTLREHSAKTVRAVIQKADLLLWDGRYVAHPWGEVWVRLLSEELSHVPSFPCPTGIMRNPTSVWMPHPTATEVEEAGVYPGFATELA